MKNKKIIIPKELILDQFFPLPVVEAKEVGKRNRIKSKPVKTYADNLYCPK